MIIQGELSLNQKDWGRKGLLLFSFMNGIALTCVTGNILSLFLLEIKCSPSLIAVISSIGYLAMLFAFIGKFSIAKIGAASTIQYSWIICSFSIILLASVPFLFFLSFHKAIIISLLLGTNFIFSVFKAIGTSAMQPLMGELTDKNNQGTFSAKFFLYYTIATIIAILAILGLVSIIDNLLIYQIIIFSGALCILFSSSIFIKIKETDLPKKSASVKNTTIQSLKTIWKDENYRNFLFAKSFGRSILILTVPISILALVKIYGVSNWIVLFFACIQLFGGVFITYFSSIISEETGPKPLIIIYFLLLILICTFWILAPPNFTWMYCFIIFFVGGICLFGLDSSLNHYYLILIPRDESVGISIWFTIICGLVSGLIGLVLGGGLIKLLSYSISYQYLFKYYYFIILILSLPILILLFRLKSVSSWKISDVLSLAISPYELKTLFILHNTHKHDQREDEISNILNLQCLKTQLSEEAIARYLNSPIYSTRISALRALTSFEVGEKTKLAVLKELQKGDYSAAYLAAAIFAKNKMPTAIPILRKYLSSRDIHLKANSMVALASMNDCKSYNKIIEVFKLSSNPCVVTNGAIALQILKDIGTVKYLLQKITLFYNPQNNTYEYIIDELVCSIAEIYGFHKTHYKALRVAYDNYQEGILNLLESIDRNRTVLSSTQPDIILKSFLKNQKETGRIIKYLLQSINALPKKETLKYIAIYEYLEETEPKIICPKIIVCIWIILFCKKL